MSADDTEAAQDGSRRWSSQAVRGIALISVLLAVSAGTWTLARGGGSDEARPATAAAPPAAAPVEASGTRASAAPAPSTPGQLTVSEQGRFLQHADGTPFFYLGDTAWELLHRLNREEAGEYLEDRRSKGFTVVQAVALAEQGGLSVANAYGHYPLVNRDPTRPDVREGAANDYWDHVDHVVERAADLGLHVALLPTWGDKVEQRWGWDGEPIFTTENARAYGRFLGERYRDRTNLIWVLGGDRGPNDDDIEIWREMGRGLKEGDDGRHLITYHPIGENTSSSHVHHDDLFDFNMLQSGHCASFELAAQMVADDYAKHPAKPVIDAEPHYEDHPVCFKPELGWWDSHDARRSAFLQTFSGAFGHTYGHHAVWQFHEAGQTGASAVRTDWRTALEHPGAQQVQHARWLLESRPFFTRVPAQHVLVGGSGRGEGLLRATQSSDGSYLAVYAGDGSSFGVDLEAVSGSTVRAWWYDPRTGAASRPREFENAGGERDFDPPGEPGRDNDWVLVLDDAARGFPAPGQQSTAGTAASDAPDVSGTSG